MNKGDQHRIEVWAHWEGFSQPNRIGILHAALLRGKEIFSFEYEKEWLDSQHAQNLDPMLGLYSGKQFVPEGHENFGMFLDSAPDRWGRLLMQRREAQLAREEGRRERRLLESDYLLGVYDMLRMGALRFKTASDGPFLDDDHMSAVPPWISLRELEHASLQLEKDDSENDPNYRKWLYMLMAPGASLGGARPKASVSDSNGHSWIAKFPSRHDILDIGAWEKVVHNLAIRAGVTTPVAKTHKFASAHHTFLSKRFDRTDQRERSHFASAMTLLNRTDGDDATKGVSYLDLAELIIQQGAYPDTDLEQLWRRIVFFICVSNIDDHLRNHGFLLHPKGWVLSPAYDMNPVATANGLKLNISESDNALDLELAKSVAEYFRVNGGRADDIIREVVAAVRTWRQEAKTLGISAREQDRMSSAFRAADLDAG